MDPRFAVGFGRHTLDLASMQLGGAGEPPGEPMSGGQGTRVSPDIGDPRNETRRSMSWWVSGEGLCGQTATPWPETDVHLPELSRSVALLQLLPVVALARSSLPRGGLRAHVWWNRSFCRNGSKLQASNEGSQGGLLRLSGPEVRLLTINPTNKLWHPMQPYSNYDNLARGERIPDLQRSVGARQRCSTLATPLPGSTDLRLEHLPQPIPCVLDAQ